MTVSDPFFLEALELLEEGSFTRLEELLGGPEGFDHQIVEWHRQGYFTGHDTMLAEALTAACMLGRMEPAAYLLDQGVDPLAGIKTGLNGFHYAASSARLGVIRLLLERKVSLEVENMYGGTVLGQALWSAIHEYRADRDSHADIIEALIEGGARIQAGTLEWWNEQEVPSLETRRRVSGVLERHAVSAGEERSDG
jgi:hypothetical protein